MALSKRDRKMAEKSEHEEEAAIKAYKKRAKATKSKKLKKIFLHNKKEEMQHAKMLEGTEKKVKRVR